jgi:DNA-binding HxlR family transcriptional regulator
MTEQLQDRLKQKFLLLLLSGVEQQGNNLKALSESLNKTKQALNYHLKKLLLAGFAERGQSFPFAIYSLTPLGARVKKILTQSDSVTQLWRVHNLIVGFEIKDFGNFSWKRRKISEMNNWHYTEETIKDSIGEWKIHIQSTGLLKIYCPARYGENPDLEFGVLERIASNLAEKYAETYGMKLGLLKQIREADKELVNSEVLGKLFGTTKVLGVYADASTGTAWLEEKQSSNKIEELLEMPGIMKEIGKEISDIKVLMQGTVPTQQAISNTQLMMVVLLKEMREEFRKRKK